MQNASSADETARFSVAGRSILITGATGAMGTTAALSLVRAGANVTAAGGDSARLSALIKELHEEQVTGSLCTVAGRPDSPETAATLVEAAVSAYGRLDGLIVASGQNKVAPIQDMPVDDFDAVMDANVRGSWLACQAATRQLLMQGDGGSIVLVSSTRGKLGHPAGYSAYCPSKAAVDLLAKSLAAELGPQKIRVNAVAPTVFRSDLTAWMYADDEKGRTAREGMLARIPLGRLAEPDDFIGSLMYLLSNASSFVTGQVLYLDGGYTAC